MGMEAQQNILGEVLVRKTGIVKHIFFIHCAKGIHNRIRQRFELINFFYKVNNLLIEKTHCIYMLNAYLIPLGTNLCCVIQYQPNLILLKTHPDCIYGSSIILRKILQVIPAIVYQSYICFSFLLILQERNDIFYSLERCTSFDIVCILQKATFYNIHICHLKTMNHLVDVHLSPHQIINRGFPQGTIQ